MILAFALDKPSGLTSNQTLTQIKRKFKIKKMGHIGTLDPFATGVLPIFIDEATKLIPYLDDSKKTYRAILSLGKSTDTLDSTGLVIEEKKVPEISEKQILETLRWFVGYRKQTPPRYSAVKIKGKPLYRYAREGQEVKVEPRDIHIYSLKLLSFENNQIFFETEVSRGTYIRVLGEEIAQSLGSVGHLSDLRRIQSGCFHLEKSFSLDSLFALKSLESLAQAFDAREILKDLQSVQLKEKSLFDKFLKGQEIQFSQENLVFSQTLPEASPKLLVYFHEQLCGVGEVCSVLSGNIQLKPLRIIHSAFTHF